MIIKETDMIFKEEILLKYIYGCKMFRSSSRKNHIKANIANPINVELVQQIQDLTDDSEDTVEKVNPSENKSERKILKGPSSSPSGGSYSTSLSHGSEPSEDDIFIPDETDNNGNKDENFDDSDSLDTSDESVDEDTSDENVESSEAITAVVEDELDINQLKSILNESSSLTYGVSRISERNNEVWVYYNDDVNLNPMLSDIIYAVESSKFKNLEFNRIARSDNAVVFEKVDNDG
jgi:hypothetical protein